MFPSAAGAGLELWHSHFVGKDLLYTPQAAFQWANPVTFPNVRKMLVGVMVLPVTSCEVAGFHLGWAGGHLPPLGI